MHVPYQWNFGSAYLDVAWDPETENPELDRGTTDVVLSFCKGSS